MNVPGVFWLKIKVNIKNKHQRPIRNRVYPKLVQKNSPKYLHIKNK